MAEAEEKNEVHNILLQEDLAIRGGAQLWLHQCGRRMMEQGHNVTFLLREDSLIKSDCEDLKATVETYNQDEIAEDPEKFREQFTRLLNPASLCITLVRQKRGKFQNVGFVADCIEKANLKTKLVAKTGTPDPTYETSFYGGNLIKNGQARVIAIAEYTRQFIIKNMGVDEKFITTIYNGTDVSRFKRTDEMRIEAFKRYPCKEDAFVVGAIGSFVPRKGQSVLLKAAQILKNDGRVPNIHILMVGEGPDKEMLQNKIIEYELQEHASIFDFTKQPFYVFERCDLICLPSIGKEGLPNVLLEALAMEKPCVSSDTYGCPEVVLPEKTGYLCPPGDHEELANCISKIKAMSVEDRQAWAKNGRDLVFAEHDRAKQFEKLMNFLTSRLEDDVPAQVVG